MHQPVQHGGSDGRTTGVLVPELGRPLTGEYGGGPFVAVVDNLHQGAPLFA